MNENKSLETLYQEREKFVLLGLTGRTGSGCSTTANLLTKSINDLDLPKPNSPGCSNTERKYGIVHKYCSQHWKQFTKISVTNIIASFILENNFFDFSEYIKGAFPNIKIPIQTLDDLKSTFETYYGKRSELSDLSDSTSAEIKTKSEFAYTFYLSEMSEFIKILKKFLNELEPEAYTRIFQDFGNNIRMTGKPLDSENIQPDAIFTIPRKINKLIKSIRKVQENNSAFIVIDAIRNPFEASYFRDRYSAFYLISVNTPNKARIDRLRKSRKDLNDLQIERLDTKEYSSKLKDSQKFISQDVQKCIEIADIHLNNPQRGEQNYTQIKRQLAWYITLIMHPGLVTPTPLERCMQIALSAKLNSGCISRQVGAVITDENYSIKAVGWNNSPEGQVPCLLRNVESLIRNDDANDFSSYENNNTEFREVITSIYPVDKHSEREAKLSGRIVSFCFKDLQNSIDGQKNQVHTRSLHAEENAFLQLSKYGGEGIKDGVLFSTASPCELCAKKAYQLGIKQVIYIDPYPGISQDHILESGTLKPELVLFSGAIGRAYHQLYQPILPFKDELAMLISTQNPTSKLNEDKKKIKQLEEENDQLKQQIKALQNPNTSLS